MNFVTKNLVYIYIYLYRSIFFISAETKTVGSYCIFISTSSNLSYFELTDLAAGTLMLSTFDLKIYL